jgi:signal transduction histidine kinase
MDMSDATVVSRGPGWWRAAGARLGGRVIAAGQGLVFFGLMLLGASALLALLLAMLLVAEVLSPAHRLNLQVLLPLLVLTSCTVPAVRWLAQVTRRLSGRWCGVPITASYRPRPGGEEIIFWPGSRRRLRWLLTDPATWRDLLWLAADACGGWVLAVAPAGLVAYGLADAVAAGLSQPFARTDPAALGVLTGNGPGAIALGAALAATGLWAAPRLLHAYGGLARLMLAPTRQSELAAQVAHLARTRSDSIDTGAAELRRIERDLHDGAQARLVAMGMTLDAAGQLVDDNPAAARALILEARDSSAKALRELRDLVRGIHPPVLADRGLTDAIRALALDAPLRVQVAGGLPGQAPAPAELAAYFAVSELLANVTKHARARQAWVDIRHERGMLAISVADDGDGGADTARGTGLAGIERRLAALDGVLALSSPPGGPTVANLEIPCALSSPKTSSSSGTA